MTTPPRQGAHEHAERPAGQAAPRRTPTPHRYKLALLTWTAAYAVTTTLFELLGPSIASWPLELRTLVLSGAMVAAVQLLIMPRLARVFARWLYPV